MATTILRTEGCFCNRFRQETLSLDHPLRSRRYHNPNTIKPKSNNDFSNYRRRKRSPAGLQSRRQSEPMVAKLPGKNLVMGQVQILKRGETLIAATEKTYRGRIHGSRGKEEFDLALGSTNRLGPDPEMMQKQIKPKEFKIGGFFYWFCFFSFAAAEFASGPWVFSKDRKNILIIVAAIIEAAFGMTSIGKSGLFKLALVYG